MDISMTHVPPSPPPYPPTTPPTFPPTTPPAFPPTFPPAISLPNGYEYPQSGVYAPPPHTHYVEVPLSTEEVGIIGTIIGRGGFYFKKITEAARVHYIFYRPERSVVEVWGPEHSLRNAVGRIKRRIQAAKDMLVERDRIRARASEPQDITGEDMV
jgi:hypothetical protein